MIVPAGKLSITGPSGTGFSPLVRTFPPVILVNFTRDESRAFIDKKLGQVGLGLKDGVFDNVFETTEGHPHVLSAYMHTAYTKLQSSDTELNETHFKAAGMEFIPTILSPFFSRFYDSTGKMSNSILSLMAGCPGCETSLSDLCKKMKKKNNELSPHLAKLVQDGAIIRTDRGKYKLFHHLLGEYIKRKREERL
jgi:hypothetical protein